MPFTGLLPVLLRLQVVQRAFEARGGVGPDMPEVAAPTHADHHREDDADQAEDRARHGKAGVLDVTAEGGFKLRYLIDATTRLPIMVSWQLPPTNAEPSNVRRPQGS